MIQPCHTRLVMHAVAICGCLILVPIALTQQVAPAPVQQQKMLPAPLGQPGQPQPTPPVLDSEFSDAISPPMDRQVKKRLEAAEQDYIKNKSWGEAAKLLQSILDGKEDVFVKVQREKPGKPMKPSWVSARAEANRLLGTMPKEGLEFYELQYGAQARAMLDKAKAGADRPLLAEVTQKYFHTTAGAEAADLLGTYFLDRGQPHSASRWYSSLLAREGADQLTPFTLYKAALAFRLAGDPAHGQMAEQTWRRVTAKSRDGIKLGDRVYSLDQMRKEFDEATAGSWSNIYDWTLYRANAARSSQARGSAPFLESKWQKSTIPERGGETKAWVQQALKQNSYRSDPLLPAFFPVAAAGKLIYRDYRGIQAVNIKTGELEWESSPMMASLDALLAPTNLEKKQPVSEWFALYMQGSNHNIIFENSTVGTLSTDKVRVYAVDDLGVPPHPGSQQLQPWGWGGGATLSGPMLELAQRNRLVAFDVESGKLLWERGDPQHDASELAGSYFLGPPLPLEGRLFVLTEKNAELRLVCLHANKGDVDWSQTLGTVRDRLMLDVSRRVQAVHLSYDEGMLICPTNAGAILGIDVHSRSLMWAYPYREKSKTPDNLEHGRIGGGRGRGMQVWNNEMGGIKLGGDWKMSAPIIHDNKVIFTAPDAPSIYCLSLSDGEFLWQADRKDDLYLAAVHNGKVILVGKNTCRAISLADGKTRIWEVQTGLPSGQGVAGGSNYYLPLKKGEVCTIDMDQGLIVSHNPAPKGEVPGNLLFYDGDMVSQTESLVSAYPQVETKVAQINELLAKNPRDAVALTERGEMKLYKGDLAGAVSDLREAASSNPKSDVIPKTRAKLYTTLTELLQRDFAAAEPYLNEYRELCKIAIPDGVNAEERKKLEEEERHRQAGFLCLLGRGREKQGKYLEAFHAYLDFGALADSRELVAVINEPTVKAQPNIWAQGRIASLVSKATPEERKPLEAEIVKRWKAVRDGKDLEAHRKFVEAFGSLFSVGREARIALAERLVEENIYLEAEMHLLELRRTKDDPVTAGRATESLARLSAGKGLLDDAAYYYRILGKQYTTITIRDGKTGADYFRDLATDKRFLPYLDEEDLLQLEGKVKAQEVPQGTYLPMQLPMEGKGELGPFFQRHRLALFVNNTNNLHTFQLKVIDREKSADKDGGNERWNIAAPPTAINYMFNNASSLRFPFHAQGHMVVLYLGHRVYGLDLVNQKKLWERDLINPDRATPQQPYVQQLLSLDKEGSLFLSMPQGLQKLGAIGPVTASYVCLLMYDGLTAIDPVTGKTLWTKSDVLPEATHVFGDDQYVYLVDVRRDNSVGATRVLRGRDGATVDALDFGSVYQRRQRVSGGRILLTDTDPKGGQTFRLYDIVQGKDLWKRTAPANALLLRSEEDSLTGIVDPDGKLTIVDLTTQKEIFHGKVSPDHLLKVTEGLLIADKRQFFVLLNRQQEPTKTVRGSWTNVVYLRSTPANGMLYAFDRATSKLSWYVAISNQMLLLEQFAELPMVVFTAQYHRMQENNASNFTAVAATISVDKLTGKRLYDKEGSPTRGQFHAMQLNRRAGVIDLISNTMRLRHTIGDAIAPEEVAPAQRPRPVQERQVIEPIKD